jgi:hypothetical protein
MAEHGDPYRSAMYVRPQEIWVFAFVAQSAPADAILLPGRACTIPVAPLLLL